jgi:hypothetical protein
LFFHRHWDYYAQEVHMKKLVAMTFGLFLNVPEVAGGIYKWVDEQGEVHFGDQPPLGATVTQKDAWPAAGGATATGSGLRAGERARLSEIEKQERSEAAEKRDQERQAAADERRRERQVMQDAKRCASTRQKISEYKRRLRAGCRVSACNSYNAQLDSYQSKAARVCR